MFLLPSELAGVHESLAMPAQTREAAWACCPRGPVAHCQSIMT